MKAKYAHGVDPLRKEQSGFTFRNSPEVSTVSQGQRNDRHRRPAQWQRMKNLERCVKAWREFTPQQQQAWKDFAFNYPVPTRADGNKFLNGYQLFVKRNYYCALNFTFQEDLLIDPGTAPEPSEDIDFSIEPSDTVIDATQLYLSRFGVMPKVGDYLYLRAIAYGEQNGFFYKQFNTRLEVQQVPLDGLFISVIIPKSFRNASVSVYLSRPYSPGREFFNSEVRYMGCFTAKTFLQLQDTPDSYEHEAGNIVVVNPGEDGLEFKKPEDIPGLGGAETFLELTDTPNSYSGEAGKIPAVNQSEDGLEFVSPPAGEPSLWQQETGYVRLKQNIDSVVVGLGSKIGNYRGLTVNGAMWLAGLNFELQEWTAGELLLFNRKFTPPTGAPYSILWMNTAQVQANIGSYYHTAGFLDTHVTNQPFIWTVDANTHANFSFEQMRRSAVLTFNNMWKVRSGRITFHNLDNLQLTLEIKAFREDGTSPYPVVSTQGGNILDLQSQQGFNYHAIEWLNQGGIIFLTHHEYN